MPLGTRSRCADLTSSPPSSLDTAALLAEETAANHVNEPLELAAAALGPDAEELQPPAKRLRDESASPAVRAWGGDLSSSTPAPAVAISTPGTEMPTAPQQAAMQPDSSPAGCAAAEPPLTRGSKLTATVLMQRGVKVTLTGSGLPRASGEPRLAQKVTIELLLRAAEASALIISLHGSTLKQLAAFKRASKEKVLAYTIRRCGRGARGASRARRGGEARQARSGAPADGERRGRGGDQTACREGEGS